jgi:hypothetical protein
MPKTTMTMKKAKRDVRRGKRGRGTTMVSAELASDEMPAVRRGRRPGRAMKAGLAVRRAKVRRARVGGAPAKKARATRRARGRIRAAKRTGRVASRARAKR